MARQLVITFTDEQFDRWTKEIGEIVGIATFIEAGVEVKHGDD